MFAGAAVLALLPASHGLAQNHDAPAPGSAAADIANFFSHTGDQIYEHCIFELSEEQIEVQEALIEAYIGKGAIPTLAKQLALRQIQPPKLSEECEQVRNLWRTAPAIVVGKRSAAKGPKFDAALPRASAKMPGPANPLNDRKMLPQWDCAPGIDYVTIHHRGYERKLTDGDICSPFDDVVRKVPDSPKSFRLGYTIETGRLFVISEDAQANGRTIAWAISGREACRNNPDPDCLATRAIGSLPPGEYAFASDPDQRVSWGPRTQRLVAGVFMTKLWYKERFTPQQTAAIMARGNIAIHVRLKGEMSEACLALEPKGWAYVSGLIKEGRATGLNVYVEEPYQQVAEAPPVIRASAFSLTSLFK
jgi:hypothetical protein